MILRGKHLACLLAVVLLFAQTAAAQFGTNVPLAPVPPYTGGHHGAPIVTNQPIAPAPVYTPPPGMPAPPPAAFDPYHAPVAPGPMLGAPGLGAPLAAPPVFAPGAFGGDDAVCGAVGPYFFFEALWLKAFYPHTPFALVANVNNNDLQPLSANFGSDFGFRIGAGWRFADGWDLGFAYTDFDTDGRLQFQPAADEVLLLPEFHPLLLFSAQAAGQFGTADPIPILVADEATEILGLRYRVWDFEAGRKFCICRTLVLRPFAGIRFADLQHMRTTTFFDTGPPAASYQIRRNMDMDAVGARVGSFLAWNIADSGFQAFARSSMSLLYADFTYNRVDTFNANINTPPAALDIASSSNSFKDVVPVLEIALGLRCQIGRLFVEGGWELQNWFNVVHDFHHHAFIDNDNVAPTVGFAGTSLDRGDIGIHGFFLRGGWNF